MKKLFERLRLYVLRKLYAIPKELRDRDDAKLGAIIENHIDDETWLLKKIGIDDHYKFRKPGCRIDREKVNEFISRVYGI